jgi:hypothetical protein
MKIKTRAVIPIVTENAPSTLPAAKPGFKVMISIQGELAVNTPEGAKGGEAEKLRDGVKLLEAENVPEAVNVPEEAKGGDSVNALEGVKIGDGVGGRKTMQNCEWL